MKPRLGRKNRRLKELKAQEMKAQESQLSRVQPSLLAPLTSISKACQQLVGVATLDLRLAPLDEHAPS